MPYTQLKITLKENVDIANEILIAELSELEFESFEEREDGLDAYVQSALFDENATSQIIENFTFTHISAYEVNEIEDQNWNEEWKRTF